MYYNVYNIVYTIPMQNILHQYLKNTFMNLFALC